MKTTWTIVYFPIALTLSMTAVAENLVTVTPTLMMTPTLTTAPTPTAPDNQTGDYFDVADKSSADISIFELSNPKCSCSVFRDKELITVSATLNFGTAVAPLARRGWWGPDASRSCNRHSRSKAVQDRLK